METADPSFEALSISIVFMVYNEAETLREAVQEVLDVVTPMGRDFEVLIIDDCSEDDTPSIVANLQAERAEIRVIRHEVNQGLGGVYRTAYAIVSKDVAYFSGADLAEIPEAYFRDMFPCLKESDLVVGVDRRRDAPWLHRLFSRAEGIIFRMAFPRIPKVGGPLIIRTRLLKPERLHFAKHPDRCWIILWEMVIRAVGDGARVATVPTDRRPRQAGRTKASTWKNGVRMLRQLLTLRRII